MKKIIISISILASMSCTNKDYKKELILDETVGWMQDMREWMIQDVENGVIPVEYAEYYLLGFDYCEDRLIELDSINRL